MKTLILIALLVILGACSAEHSDPMNLAADDTETGADVNPGDETGIDIDTDCLPDELEKVDFNQLKAQVLDNQCLTCHGNSGFVVPFENYTDAQALAGRIQARIQDGTMPPSGPLSDDQKNLVAAWINIGTPEKIDDVEFCED
ncbi:MAG: cytochrome c [Bdellovibrionales bacterium]|nr:cytochrome c [Bdellovibrionales bacterium]NQZ20196.1 cytochrome c [Bdellovibrionales bacterium]